MRARFLIVDDDLDLLQALGALGMPVDAARLVGGALPQGHLLVSGLAPAVDRLLREEVRRADLRLADGVSGAPRLLLSGRLEAMKRVALKLQERPDIEGALEAGGRILRACFHAGRRETVAIGPLTAGAGRTLVMGILNVTPDSFSDGGRFLRPEAALRRAHELVDAGADLLDVGGESTRPRGPYGEGAQPVTQEQEIARVLPVLEGLARDLPGVPVSVDTSRAAVAERAIAAGATMINDVRGLASDELADVVRRHPVACCLMHTPGEPQVMAGLTSYEDVLGEVADALCERVARAEARGVPPARLLVDPGFGFGKTAGQGLFLLRHLRTLRSAVGRPLLVGTSRKAFLGAATGVADPAARDRATAASVALAIAGGACVVRVHDAASCRDAVRLADAVASAQEGGAFFETGD